MKLITPIWLLPVVVLVVFVTIIQVESYVPCAPNNDTTQNTQTQKSDNKIPEKCGGWFYRTALLVLGSPNEVNAASALITAISTIFIAVFTFSLMYSTRRQWDVANRNFIATHRPKIFVRFVQGPLGTRDDKTMGYVTVVNIGNSLATIFEVGLDMPWRSGEAWVPPGLSARVEPIDPIRLASGEKHTFKVYCSTPRHEFNFRLHQLKLCIFGTIRYRDDIGVVRETGLLWEFSKEQHEFVRSNDREWDYQD